MLRALRDGKLPSGVTMLMQLLSDFRYAARRLGASPGFTAAAVATIAIGAVVGLRAGLAVSRILPSVLFGVSSADVFALVATLLVVGGVALTAGFLPARRASRVDPNTVLHYE